MDTSEGPVSIGAESRHSRPISENWHTANDGTWSESGASRRPSAPATRIIHSSTASATSSRRKPSQNIETTTITTAGFVSHITPPQTPVSPSPDSEMDLQPAAQSLFHNYLRAMYSFAPSAESMPDDDASQSAVALRPGDLILVHCVHANGWADGTVLNTSERGWLPTNYCEAYDHPYLRNLLNAMTQFWDLLGASEDASLSTFVRQDYIRGLIAGVRYLLERADCLHRDAATVKRHAGVRRMRKGLLADLSSLVQIAKKLQETIGEAFAGEVIHVLLDDLISKAFRMVTRAASFTDVWTTETKKGESKNAPRRPLTPPIESIGLAIDTQASVNTKRDTVDAIDSAKHFPEISETSHTSSHETVANEEQKFPEERAPRLSMAFSPPDGLAAHRVSLVPSESNHARSGPLALEQLAKVHDICISHIGAFIGHHLHSRPSAELVATTERLVQVCRNLLAIIDEVYTHDPQKSSLVQQSKDEFEIKLEELAKSTQDVFRFSDSEDDDVIMLPDKTNHLISVGTNLIRNTGECVVKTRQLIEQIGDFELRTVQLSGSNHEIPRRIDSMPQDDALDGRSSKRISIKRMSKILMPPPPPVIKDDTPLEEEQDVAEPSTTEKATVVESTTTAAPEQKPLPPPPAVQRRSTMGGSQSSSLHVDTLRSPRSVRADSTSPARKDSVGFSISGSTDTFCSSARDSRTTIVSVSTRATTPDKEAPSDHAMMSSFASISSMRSLITDDSIDGEALLQQTYAHELTFNKDGQVTGGSLSALVEQLTTHDSAPDPQFVTAFFLTFRKFCEPREFAQALIQRFDYIGDSRTVGTPARLRIYNVFKGWLETYWCADADKDALGEIRFFAMHKLKQVLPAAGDRLAELTKRITEGYANGKSNGPLVSGVGKSSMSIGSHLVNNAANVPEPLITLKQLNAIRVANGGGAACSIIDFDPKEIARQITLLVMKEYCEIRPEELLSMDWTRPNTKRAKNVRNMCQLNTDLSHLVNDSILAPEDPKKRAKTIKQWARIGTACLELSNYDCVMAIMCSIHSSVIQRLKKTWDLVKKPIKAELDALDKVVDMSKNYSMLRKRLESPTAPCLPFLGVYLTDLTFVLAGNPKRRELPGSTSAEGGPISVINFDMYMRIAKIISHLQKFQVQYKLKPVPEVQTWLEQYLQRMRGGHDDMVSIFHRRSLAVEPKQEERKHTLSFRSESDAQRPPTAGGHHATPPPTTMERFDFFHKSTSFMNMRSQTTLSIHADPD
ncbi:Ras guanine nucleotide exchange factor A [Fulvia fulva]|nr:Ras guanine nucleotide exchange factor A [Fulvia fulva]KAK4611359.1 Ras guanine nucleotide exchange factor A [Fulvia fulva]WPV22376.1 Ras guanine nucleotide exchange factor A [Fulvia fulva]WPV37135.1 Ras guanine nucleotide exchange factor A [Fulvia fulva]